MNYVKHLEEVHIPESTKLITSLMKDGASLG
jgi:hypothetical protein